MVPEVGCLEVWLRPCSHVLIAVLCRWVEAEGFGNGGPDWVERHIEAWANIGGCMLGVPKAMAAFMSGEMRDTVELNPAGEIWTHRLTPATNLA